MTLEWIDGIKLTDRDALVAAGHDLPSLAAILVRAFLRQSVIDGFFHADLHQGNLFALPDGPAGGDRLRHHGPDRPAGAALAGRDPLRPAHRQLPPGRRNPFRRRSMCPPTTISTSSRPPAGGGRADPRLPVKDISIGQMLDGLFTITRDFEMPTQPHLLLLQKTMVMEEGVAHALDPDINMWETAEPFLRDWMRGELGPRRRSRTGWCRISAPWR
jgi:ubiquinone biosynthesis protein